MEKILSSFSGEKSEWKNWAEIHLTNVQSLECDRAFDVPAGGDIKVGSTDFSNDDHAEDLVYEAQVAWRSPITTCNGTARNLVMSSQSPSET